METKATLLEKALECFSSCSYEGCGIQEICDSAGVTKPTLYHHFGSKYGLLRDVVTWMMRPLLSELDEAWKYDGDLPLTLTKLTQAFFSFAQNHPTELRYYLSLHLAPYESDSRQAVKSVNELITRKISEVFQMAAEDHGNMKDRHVMLTAGFLGMVNTLGALVAEDRMDLTDHTVYRAVQQFSHGIYS